MRDTGLVALPAERHADDIAGLADFFVSPVTRRGSPFFALGRSLLTVGILDRTGRKLEFPTGKKNLTTENSELTVESRWLSTGKLNFSTDELGVLGREIVTPA